MILNDFIITIKNSGLKLSDVANAFSEVTPLSGVYAGRPELQNAYSIDLNEDTIDFKVAKGYLNTVDAEQVSVTFSIMLTNGLMYSATKVYSDFTSIVETDIEFKQSGGGGESYDDTEVRNLIAVNTNAIEGVAQNLGIVSSQVSSQSEVIADVEGSITNIETRMDTAEEAINTKVGSTGKTVTDIELYSATRGTGSAQLVVDGNMIINSNYQPTTKAFAVNGKNVISKDADGVKIYGEPIGGGVPTDMESTNNKVQSIASKSDTQYPSTSCIINTLQNGVSIMTDWEFTYSDMSTMPFNLETERDAYYIRYKGTDAGSLWVLGFAYKLADKTKPVYILNDNGGGATIEPIGPNRYTLYWGQYLRYSIADSTADVTIGYEAELWTNIPSIASVASQANNALASASEAKEHIKIESIQAIDVILPESHPTGSNYVGDHWCYRPADEDIALSLHAIGDKQDTIFRLKAVYPARSGTKRVQVVVDNDMYASDPHNIYVINDTDDDVDILNDSWSTLSTVHPHTIALFVNGDNRVYASEIADYTGTSQCTICKYDREAYEEDLPKTVTYVNDAVVALDSRVSAIEQGGGSGSQVVLHSNGRITGVVDESGNEVTDLYAGTITIN